MTATSGATFGGHGTVTGSVTIDRSATLSPGHSIGTLTVNGDLSLASGSVTRIELQRGGTPAVAGTDNDTLRVSGTATVAAERLAAGEYAAGIMAGMASGGLKLLNGALALLGGPVGIAVMGAVLLAEKFFSVKHAADEANLAIVQLWRAQDAQVRGKPAEARDISSVDANLEKSKQERDALLAGNANKQDIAYAQAKVDTWQKNADKLHATQDRLTAGTQGITLSLTQLTQQWEQANAEFKTAGSIQEDFAARLAHSKESYGAMVQSMVDNGAASDALDKVAAQQDAKEAGRRNPHENKKDFR